MDDDKMAVPGSPGVPGARDYLKETDDAAAATAVAPRVTLADIEAAIEHKYFIKGTAALDQPSRLLPEMRGGPQLHLLTICILVMRNGFMVVGTSAPASPENYSEELGKKFSYEDCVRQLWKLMGFALRERLHRAIRDPAHAGT